MSRNVYVAGSCKEIPRVRLAQDYLRERGVTITHDWTVDVTEAGGESNPAEATDRQKRTWANRDLTAIDEADACLFLGTQKPSPGMHVELGYAIGSCNVLVWAGHQPSIFNHLCHFVFLDDLDACDRVLEYLDGR
jgi:hypothetical protein